MTLQIITLSLIIFVPVLAWKQHPSKWATLGVVAYTLSYFLTNSWQVAMAMDPPAYGLALRMKQLATLGVVFMYVGIIFYAVSTNGRPDHQSKLVWLVVLIAEGFAVLEYAECKVLVDPFGSGDKLLSEIWGVETSRFACGRVFGEWTAFAAPIITSIYLILIFKPWRRLRPR